MVYGPMGYAAWPGLTKLPRMTTEETEKYNQLYQDFYKDMYD